MAASGLADHYGVLGVESGAEEAAIKKAYRKLVLQWHPDKHPADRDEAEVKIRQINDAYETLSNPFKRQQYDHQVGAFMRKAQGFRLDTAGIKPRMAIPKEFMLSPMGYPAKFVRSVGSAVFVQSRTDITAEFEDFFKVAKFSLWWLPEINNMCRLRVQSTVSDGYGGGIHVSFALSRQVSSSEVVLSGSEEKESSALIAVASPSFEGAFRFESACFPGHYLAFLPPNHLRMIGGNVEGTTTIDFVLVDYGQMFRFITMEEVLLLTVFTLGGAVEYVSLDQVRAERNTQMYFARVVQRPIWQDEDFATFFESRSESFAYDVDRRMVRLRSKQEILANSLQRARTAEELAATVSRSTISKAGEELFASVSLETFELLLDTLGPPPPDSGGASAVVNHMDAQMKVLAALPKACSSQEVPFSKLLEINARVMKLGGEQPDLKIAERRLETAKELGIIVSQQVEKNGVGDKFAFETLVRVCEMPLDWKLCGDALAKAAGPLLQGRSLEALLPLLRAVVKASSSGLTELLGNAVWQLVQSASPQVAAEAIEVLAMGGLHLDQLPSTLRLVHQLGAPFPAVAAAVAALGERGVEGDDMRVCAGFLASAPHESLEELPPAALLRLMVAATKSAVVAETALDTVAATASVILQAFGMDEASKLLLAAAKAKGGADGAGVKSLYSRAAEVLAPKLRELSVVQLIKIVLAIGKAAPCRPLLEAAGSEALGRMTDMSPAHLLLLVQGLVPLTGSHPVFEQILESLITTFREASRKEKLLGEDMIVDRRRELEVQGQLSADNVAKLAQMLAPVVPSNHAFWEAFGRRMEELPKSLTSAGHASMDTAFPDGAGPKFDGKRSMLRLVAAALSAKERGAKDAVDMTARERAAQKQRDYEKYEKERQAQLDKEHLADEKERRREREKALQRAKGDKKGRSRSRSRSRSRDRRDKDKSKKKRSRSRSRDRKSRSRSRDRDRDRRRK